MKSKATYYRDSSMYRSLYMPPTAATGFCGLHTDHAPHMSTTAVRMNPNLLGQISQAGYNTIEN